MQVGGFLIPFTKPASPVMWVRPYQDLSFESNGGKVTIKPSNDRSSIESIGRIFKILLGFSLIVVPLFLASENVLVMALDSDQEKEPCNFFDSGEYIEFDDVGILCLGYNERHSAKSFEIADEHFRFESDWGGSEEYRWAQAGDVVTLCFVDSAYDEYYCENRIRVQDSLPNQNFSYYSIYGEMTREMPSWVNDRPSSVAVEYQSSMVGPFGDDRLIMSLNDETGWEELEVRSYNADIFEMSHYYPEMQRGLIETIFPYILPIVIGTFILLSSGFRVPLLEFDQQQSKIQRRLTFSTSLSRYDWNNVDFQKFTLHEHSFTVTHHHSGDEHTSSSTSYSHHSGLNLTCTYEEGTHVLFFIEDKDSRTRTDLIERLFDAIGVEPPLNPSSSQIPSAVQTSSPIEIQPPLDSHTQTQQKEETSLQDDLDLSREQAEGGFWDKV